MDFGRALLRGLGTGFEAYLDLERLALAKKAQDDISGYRDASLAREGVYRGTAPDDPELEIPVVAPGLPVQTTMKVRPDRYRQIGDTGYYQDYAQTPAAIEQQRENFLAGQQRQRDFDRRWDQGVARMEMQDRAQQQRDRTQQMLEAIRASGLFTPQELALMAAAPETIDNGVQTVLGARIRSRYDQSGTGAGGITTRQRKELTDREDDRRKSMIAGNEAKIRRADSWGLSEKVDSLEAVNDSLRARIGTMPDPDPSRQRRLEQQAVQAYQDAVRRGADPQLADQRLREYIEAIRAGRIP